MLQKTNISLNIHHISTNLNIKTTQQEVIGFSPFIGRKFVWKPVSVWLFSQTTEVEFAERGPRWLCCLGKHSQTETSFKSDFVMKGENLSLPIALFGRSNRRKYDGQSKKYQFSEAVDRCFSYMMTASIKLMTRTMDRCLILSKMRRRVKQCQRVMATLQCKLSKFEHFDRFFLPLPNLSLLSPSVTQARGSDSIRNYLVRKGLWR